MTETRTAGNRSGLEALEALPVLPADEFIGWRPTDRRNAERPEASTRASPGSSRGLAEADLRYLRAVVDQPGQPSSTYPRLARLSPARAAEIRERLVAAGYLRLHTVMTGRRGRNALVVEPLDTAQQAVAGTPDQGGA
jgi:hypothetical protein